MNSLKIGIAIILVSSITFSQVPDPMLDAEFLFSDTLMMPTSKIKVSDSEEYISRKEFLKYREDYEREIGRISREISVLKNRIALLEEGKKISNNVLYVDIVADQYADALKYYNEADYEKAGNLFAQIMSETADTDLRLNSIFWAAECSFRLGNFNRSVILLNELINHSGFSKLEDSYILLAASYEKLNRLYEANKYYLAYQRDYPQGKYTEIAGKRLGKHE